MHDKIITISLWLIITFSLQFNLLVFQELQNYKRFYFFPEKIIVVVLASNKFNFIIALLTTTVITAPTSFFCFSFIYIIELTRFYRSQIFSDGPVNTKWVPISRLTTKTFFRLNVVDFSILRTLWRDPPKLDAITNLLSIKVRSNVEGNKLF